MKDKISLHSNEEITPIRSYEGLYSITSFGRVYSHERKVKNGIGFRTVKGKFKNLYLTKGYLGVGLSKNNKLKSFKVHRLVAIHYIPNPLNLQEVNHKWGDKLDCRKDSLEWCTYEGNLYHAMKYNLKCVNKSSKYYGVHFRNNGRKKNWMVGVSTNNRYIFLGLFYTEIEGAKVYNNYIIKNNINKPLNNINEEEYLEIIKRGKNLIKCRGAFLVRKGSNKPWRSQITFKGASKFLGWYVTKLEALKAYNKFVVENHLDRPLNNIY